MKLTLKDVTKNIFSGDGNAPVLASWFQDPDGVKLSVPLKWYDLPTSPTMTINNPVDYETDKSTERIIMTAQCSWSAQNSRSFWTTPTFLSSIPSYGQTWMITFDIPIGQTSQFMEQRVRSLSMCEGIRYSCPGKKSGWNLDRSWVGKRPRLV